MDLSLVLASLATGLTLLCIYYHIKVFSFWSSRGIKGPTPWPILGTMIYYMFKTKNEVDLEWSKRFGKVYGIYEGYSPALRVTDNEIIQQVLIKDHKSFVDRNTKFVFGDNIGRWLFFSSGDHWNTQRVLITPMFTSSKMKSMFKTMNECANRFIHHTRLQLTNNKSSLKEVKAFRKQELNRGDLMSLTLDVISRAFFSLNLDTYLNKSSEFAERAFAFAKFDVGYMFVYFLIPQFVRKFLKLDLTRPYKYEYFDKLSDIKVKQRRQQQERQEELLKKTNGFTEQLNKPNDIIQYLIDATIPEVKENIYCEEDNLEAKYNDQMNLNELEEIHRVQQERKVQFRKFSDLEIRAQMTFFFLAGFETTASSLSIIIYELSHKQDLQQQIYDEIKEKLFNSNDKNFEEEQLDYSKLLDLKLLEAFISESLRLYNPVTEFTRVVTKKEGIYLPTKPNPIYLPYDTTISMPGFVVQRDPDYWQEPDKFDISRFFSENKEKIKSCTYMPFGLGPRNCAGMRFALLTIKTTLIKLLCNYRLVPGQKSCQYPPRYLQHGFFTQLKNDDFAIIPRE